MYLFIESIKCQDGKLFNLEYHQARVNRTLAEFYPNCSIDLGSIPVAQNCGEGMYKLRIIYSDIIEKYDFLPYKIKQINSLKIVHSDDLIYDYKYFDRTALSLLLKKSNTSDEIIICQNGLVTDSSYSNLVFEKDVELFTPKSPLLKGTKREKLINDGKIIPKDIEISSISQYQKIHLINSMIDLNECCVNIGNVFFPAEN
jgi:4-amino-4-deoxychorismate lyase